IYLILVQYFYTIVVGWPQIFLHNYPFVNSKLQDAFRQFLYVGLIFPTSSLYQGLTHKDKYLQLYLSRIQVLLLRFAALRLYQFLETSLLNVAIVQAVGFLPKRTRYSASFELSQQTILFYLLWQK